MKPEFTVGPDMLCALREGEQPGMADVPLRERLADRADEALADAAVPQIRADRQRAEKADAAPPRRKVGTDHATVLLGREGGGVLGAEASPHIIEIGPEILRIRCPQKGPERYPKKPFRFGKIGFCERADVGHSSPPVLPSPMCARSLRGATSR